MKAELKPCRYLWPRASPLYGQRVDEVHMELGVRRHGGVPSGSKIPPHYTQSKGS